MCACMIKQCKQEIAEAKGLHQEDPQQETVFVGEERGVVMQVLCSVLNLAIMA
jgi:hypothetical protein